jgi:hypothetical protein
VGLGIPHIHKFFIVPVMEKSCRKSALNLAGLRPILLYEWPESFLHIILYQKVYMCSYIICHSMAVLVFCLLCAVEDSVFHKCSLIKGNHMYPIHILYCDGACCMQEN